MEFITNRPKVLTRAEQKKLLRMTAEHVNGFRDHVIFSVALGTALREKEILCLDCGDVYDASGNARRRVILRWWKGKGSKKRSANVRQEVCLPDALRYKLNKFRRWKVQEGEPVEMDSPLFLSKRKIRLSDRRLRNIFQEWQEACGFERPYTFHSLRHTSLTNYYDNTKDVRLVQAIARHASINNTTIYAGPSDESIVSAVKDFEC